MRVNIRNIVTKYNIKFEQVVHVGAHWGQEYDAYIRYGAKEIVFIEPCRRAFHILEDKFYNNQNVRIINCACGDTDGEMDMFTGDYSINSGMSNSLLKPAKHLRIHPEVAFTNTETVRVRTLDFVLLPVFKSDLLVLDCQGYEGRVLKGATETLKNVKYILTEVNKTDVYENCTLVEEMDELLKDFTRVETGKWIQDSWADAYYCRKTLL